MYGKFDNFPETIQAWVVITHSSPIHELQSVLVDSIWHLNRSCEEAVEHFSKSSRPVKVRYAVGVADGVYFNFLDEEELGKLRGLLEQRPYKVLDLLLRISYHYTRPDGRRMPLKSDLQYLRFTFEAPGSFEVRIHHLRGSGWMPLDAVVRRFVDKLNEEAKRRSLPPLSISRLEGH